MYGVLCYSFVVCYAAEEVELNIRCFDVYD